MTQVLRQSTQVVVRIGPAVAVGDGFTPVTTLSLATADEAEALKAAGAATASIAGNTFAAITGADGWYDLTLSTTDTNTVGTLDIVVNDDSLILPIFARFQVIEEAAYDAIFAASASPATTTGAVGSVTGAVGSVTGAVGSVTGAVGSVTGNVGGNVVGSVGSVTGAINTAAGVITTLDALDTAQDTQHGTTQTNIAALNDLSAAEVNAEVVDALATDTYAEPGQGAPAATTSLAAKINYLFKAWRNKSTQTSTTFSLFADDGTTVDQKSTVSDDATTYTRGELASGP